MCFSNDSVVSRRLAAGGRATRRLSMWLRVHRFERNSDLQQEGKFSDKRQQTPTSVHDPITCRPLGARGTRFKPPGDGGFSSAGNASCLTVLRAEHVCTKKNSEGGFAFCIICQGTSSGFFFLASESLYATVPLSFTMVAVARHLCLSVPSIHLLSSPLTVNAATTPTATRTWICSPDLSVFAIPTRSARTRFATSIFHTADEGRSQTHTHLYTTYDFARPSHKRSLLSTVCFVLRRVVHVRKLHVCACGSSRAEPS